MSVADAYFDKLYKGSQEGWSFRERWHDQRKRNLILATLPRSHYGSIFEPACGHGELSARLAERCSQLLCSDTSSSALEQTRNRLARRGNLCFQQASLPEQWPEGRFDLIIINELGCHLSSDELKHLSQCARGALNNGGHLLACHSRSNVIAGLANAEQVHRDLHKQLDWPRLVQHQDNELLLDVWEQPGALT